MVKQTDSVKSMMSVMVMQARHFATCDMNQMTRTFRHTAVARTILKQVEDSLRTTVQPNHIAGLVHRPHRIRNYAVSTN